MNRNIMKKKIDKPVEESVTDDVIIKSFKKIDKLGLAVLLVLSAVCPFSWLPSFR